MWLNKAPGLKIEPEYFGSGKYVPLKQNRDLAFKAALEARHAFAAKAAGETTTWFMLSFRLTNDELAGCFRDGILFWSANMTGLEWWGTLPHPLGIGSLEWEVGVYDPIGLRSWSHMTLAKKCGLNKIPEGLCHGCSAAGVSVWKASRFFNHEEFCALCWHNFMQEKHPTANTAWPNWGDGYDNRRSDRGWSSW